jgi:hypothetical protein
MALDASKVLGAAQIIGAIVNPRNTARMTLGGSLGVVAGTAMLRNMTVDKADTPDIGRVGLLALTEDDIALVKVRQGFPGFKVTDQVVARVPHSSIASAELGKSTMLAPPLTITLTDGTTWNLEVLKVDTKRAKKLLELLDELRALDARGE